MTAAVISRVGMTAMEDQMVPDVTFDVVTIDGGATVFETTPSEEVASKPLPDFDSLLQDLSAEEGTSTTNSSGSASLMDVALGPKHNSSWELEAYSEISMYEDSPILLKAEKRNVVVKQEPVVEEPTVLQSLLPVQEELGLSDIAEIDELKKKITFVCQTISIPSNPYCWSPEECCRWVQWTLQSYNLPLYLADQYVMSGSALCYLTQDDFRHKSPQAGEFLSTELDIWKTAHNLSLPEFTHQEDTASSTEFYREDPPTFTDLDAVHILPPVSSMQQPMKCIPTPVITCTSSPFGTSPMTSSLNPILADSPHHYTTPISSSSTGMSVSPSPSLESLSNTSSSGTSWSYTVQNSPDMEDSGCSTEMPQTFQDVHTVPSVPHHGKHTIHLWQFLKELLLQPRQYQSCIRWLDRSKGIFKIEDSARVAKLWGLRKNRPAMNYDKLSRSIRQYYKKGIIKKTTNSKRLVYQFCPQYM